MNLFSSSSPPPLSSPVPAQKSHNWSVHLNPFCLFCLYFTICFTYLSSKLLWMWSVQLNLVSPILLLTSKIFNLSLICSFYCLPSNLTPSTCYGKHESSLYHFLLSPAFHVRAGWNYRRFTIIYLWILLSHSLKCVFILPDKIRSSVSYCWGSAPCMVPYSYHGFQEISSFSL